MPSVGPSPYVNFTRAEWGRLRDEAMVPLSETELAALRGLNERVALDEVADIYLPLCRLLNLHVEATKGLQRAVATFLAAPVPRPPYVIGLAGSVAVGKSTTARILGSLLARWPTHPKVALVTTDSFLYPNRVLERRGLMHRKGFPESYDLRALIAFLAAVKAGQPRLTLSVYSHLTYDIVPDQHIVVDRPDILLLEGLNVLQVTGTGKPAPHIFVSDYFDFSLYVDALTADLRRWYVERFLALRQTAFTHPSSHFRRYATLSDQEAERVAISIWEEINEPNLRENILPTRERARVILVKGPDHAVQTVRLRML